MAADLPQGFALEQPSTQGLPPGFKLVAPEPAFEREARQMLETTPAELIAANPTVRMLTSTAQPIMGAGSLIERLYGGTKIADTQRQLNEMQARGAKALGFGSAETIAQDIAGSTLSPLTAVATKAPLAASYAGKVLQGAELGALGGLTAGGSSPLADAATGAVVGGSIPAVTIPAAAAGKAAYNSLVEPWANPAAIKGRAFLEAAGDKADEIIAALRQNRQIVPGSMPTAGEAAAQTGRAEFANLQRQAQQINPSAYDARAGEQAAARLAQVRTVGQTPEALAAAEGARSAAADPLYAAAREGARPPGLIIGNPRSVVGTEGVAAKVDALLAKNPGNRELVTELNNIKRGLYDENGTLRVTAQEVSSVLDGLKASIADEKNKFIKGALTGLKDDLTKAIPGMERAQQVFAEKSPPINQMQVGQYLEGKLTNPLDETARQRASTYAGALRDAPATIKRSTGSPRFEELSQVLTPDQLSAVNSVRDDLARGARFEDLATKGAQAAPKIGGEIGARAPQMLSRAATVYNAIITRLEGKVDKKLAAEIAVEMLNPPKVAETMAQAQIRASRNAVITKALQQTQLPASAIAGQAVREAQ